MIYFVNLHICSSSELTHESCRVLCSCPKCGIEGALILSPATDRTLSDKQVRCPYVGVSVGQLAGVNCQWTGRLAAFKDHAHDLGDGVVKGTTNDNEENELEIRAIVGDKTVEMTKVTERGRKTVGVIIKYDVRV